MILVWTQIATIFVWGKRQRNRNQAANQAAKSKQAIGVDERELSGLHRKPGDSLMNGSF